MQDLEFFIWKISKILKDDYRDALVIDDERAGDGVRLERNDTMFVIRYSQNGPYLTIKFEAKKQKEYEKLRKYILKTLKRFPEIDWNPELKTSANLESLV